MGIRAVKVLLSKKDLQKKAIMSKSAQRVARRQTRRRIKRAQEQMIEEFEAHPVTMEIDGGPTGPNISGAVPVQEGNLFSFIGFTAGYDPLKNIRKALRRRMVIRKTTVISSTRIRMEVSGFPNKQAIFDDNLIPWSTGRSWLDGIERGISGLGHYLVPSPRKQPARNSYSSVAYQVKGKLRKGAFRNTKYLSDILTRFKKSLNKINVSPI